MSKIDIRIEVEYIGKSPEGPYRVAIYEPGVDMPLSEMTTLYPQTAAVAMLRRLDLTPKRTVYLCPECASDQFLILRQDMSGYCQIAVSDEYIDHSDETETTYQTTVGVACTNCGWEQAYLDAGKAMYPDVDDWVRAQLDKQEVSYE